MSSDTAIVIAAFTALTISLGRSFLALSKELAKLSGSIDTLVSCVRLLRETSDQNSRRIGELKAKVADQGDKQDAPDRAP